MPVGIETTISTGSNSAVYLEVTNFLPKVVKRQMTP